MNTLYQFADLSEDETILAAPKRILFLMSDTGGGHRAAAEAISAALRKKYGDKVTIELADVFRHHSPAPFKYAPEIYPIWIKRGRLMWRMGYHMSGTRGQAGFVMRSLWLATRKGLRRLFRTFQPDVIVSVHPFFNAPAIYVLNREPIQPRFVTVITDLVSTHRFWYNRHADRILVPTEIAFERGLKFGIRPEQMRITGLPIHPKFTEGLLDKKEAREKLGWQPELPVVLLIGGGEGMGPLRSIALHINRLHARCQLAIIAGRNEELRHTLETKTWNQPTHVYGFVTNMPEMMAGADLLVTKAGPGTICEAFAAGLPMIISDAIPGQEVGNVQYVVDHQAGVFARGPQRVAHAVQQWLAQGPDYLKSRAENAHQLARPNAVWEIAEEIWKQAHQPRIAKPIHKRPRQYLPLGYRLQPPSRRTGKKS